MATNGSNGSNGSKYPYPTAYAIEDMFSGTNQHEEAVALLHENVDAQIMGYDHHFAGERKGADSLATTFKEEFSSMVDKDTVKYEVTNVIGGGDSPWAAIEGKATAKSQSGKKFVHEHVYIVRFNSAGKIVKVRAYYDTHHIHNHAVQQGKASH